MQSIRRKLSISIHDGETGDDIANLTMEFNLPTIINEVADNAGTFVAVMPTVDNLELADRFTRALRQAASIIDTGLPEEASHITDQCSEDSGLDTSKAQR